MVFFFQAEDGIRDDLVTGVQTCALPISPIDGIASHQTFADLSRETNGRSPIVWQIELIDHVTWCSAATRTSEPQKKAVSAPCQDQVIRPPSTGGVASETITQPKKPREIRTMSGSFIR